MVSYEQYPYGISRVSLCYLLQQEHLVEDYLYKRHYKHISYHAFLILSSQNLYDFSYNKNSSITSVVFRHSFFYSFLLCVDSLNLSRQFIETIIVSRPLTLCKGLIFASPVFFSYLFFG